MTRPKTILKSDLIDKTHGYENEKVQVFMLTRRPRVMPYRNKMAPKDKQLELYSPKKTKYGSASYMMSIAAFKKYKSTEWDKYFLGSEAECFIGIDVPNGRGGTERKNVYPVIEQTIKNNKGGVDSESIPVLTKQGLPTLIDLFGNSKDSVLKDQYFEKKAEIKV